MNWYRAFFRLWLVLSVFWFAFMAFGIIVFRGNAPEVRVELWGYAFGVPAFTYGALRALAWIFRGLRRQA